MKRKEHERNNSTLSKLREKRDWSIKQDATKYE